MAPPAGFTKPAAPVRPKKGIEARLFGIEHGIKRNAPCPCGSGQKFKKCCFKVKVKSEGSQPPA
jgi:uncharacterized protein YecA (UPF0149 family)